MPAKRNARVAEENKYSHVYNSGTQNVNIFKNSEDYDVFIDYLREYLSPISPEGTKKTSFTVKGRVFHGIPHQPKNYFNQIELIAYSLKPNSFDLVLHQITKNSIERLIRSIGTRYSIYFNKKYNHKGTLFEGPYKSIPITSQSQLLLLTHKLHSTGDDFTFSSYPEHLGERNTSWVKRDHTLTLLEKAKKSSLSDIRDYKHFIEKYEVNEKGTGLIERVQADLERRGISNDKDNVLSSKPRVFEYALATFIFLILLSFGVHNIHSVEAKSLADSAVLSESTSSEATQNPTPTPEPKIMVVIKIMDGSESINIRKSPTTKSEKIGEAKEGDSFELVSKTLTWYEVKLEDGSTGFISGRYIEQ